MTRTSIILGVFHGALDITPMKHQIKSPKAGAHVRRVIEALQRHVEVKVYETPELEAHENA